MEATVFWRCNNEQLDGPNASRRTREMVPVPVVYGGSVRESLAENCITRYFGKMGGKKKSAETNSDCRIRSFPVIPKTLLWIGEELLDKNNFSKNR